MFLRRLTESGIEQFRSYLDQLRNDPKLTPPLWLLTDDEASEKLPVILEVEQRLFHSRLEVATYLDSVITESGLERVEGDVGLWAWLGLFYFDQICPPKRNGYRKPAVALSYIPKLKSTRYYRHLLLGPWMMFQPHRDDPKRLLALLWNPPHVATSDAYRLCIENPDFAACHAAIGAVTKLYFDPQQGKNKPGHAGNKRGDRGSCRRLLNYIQQLDCTYDLYAMNADGLVDMLPQEFERFIEDA